MARTKIADKKIAEDLTGLTITFSDDSTLTAEIAAIPAEIQRRLMLHGLSQKLGDSYSGEQNVEVARAKAEATLKRLVDGEWTVAREGGGGGRISDLAQALAEETGREIAEAVELLESMDKAQKSNLRKHPKIAARLAAIAAARAAEKAEAASGENVGDVNAMLGM